LGLLDVTNTFTLRYNNSHIQLFLDTESLTVFCVLHLWSSALSSHSCTSSDFCHSQSHITTDGQSVSLGVEPYLGLMTRYLLLFDSYGLVFCGAPSLTRRRVCFLYDAGPCQRSLSLVRVPWDSRPYFTASDLRLPFSSSPTTRRVTVEVFDPASTREGLKTTVGFSLYSLGSDHSTENASVA
jgi:hypothetical protein